MVFVNFAGNKSLAMIIQKEDEKWGLYLRPVYNFISENLNSMLFLALGIFFSRRVVFDNVYPLADWIQTENVSCLLTETDLIIPYKIYALSAFVKHTFFLSEEFATKWFVIFDKEITNRNWHFQFMKIGVGIVGN